MVHLEQLIKAWDEAQDEFLLAFKGLTDDKTWVRPHPKLLSIGELAGHVTFYENWTAVGAWGGIEGQNLPLESLLGDRRFSYYIANLAEPVVLGMGAEAVANEVKRVHEFAKAEVMELNPKLLDSLPTNERVSWQKFMNYRIFHAAYHAGQAYSVRHLLGDTPEDN
jgi:hypothetical protein